MSSFELIYTSAPRGLKSGTAGFATVLETRGTPPKVAVAAEALSGFYGGGRGRAAFSQLALKIDGIRYHFFSRIGDSGLDYSGRSNYIAHHWAFDAAEAARIGLNPGAFWASEREFFLRRWNRAPEFVPKKDAAFWNPARRIAISERRRAWEEATGDAGWGAIFAATAFCGRKAALIVGPETDLAALFWEALALLPPETARNVSFAAPFFAPPVGVEIFWRGSWAGTPGESVVRAASRDAVLFDASTPGRFLFAGNVSAPENAARFLTGDVELARRIAVARSGVDASVLGSGFDENGASGRAPLRRVAVPRGAPDSSGDAKDVVESSASDENGTVDLRRFRGGWNERAFKGAGDVRFGETASDGAVFLENDQKNDATERLNAIYERSAAKKRDDEARRTVGGTTFFWIVVAVLLLSVASGVAFWIATSLVEKKTNQVEKTTSAIKASYSFPLSFSEMRRVKSSRRPRPCGGGREK